MLVLAGEKLNLLEDDVVTCSPAQDSLYPLSNLYVGRPSQPFRFGSVAADPYVQRDGNRVTNGGFETSTLAGWVDDSDTASGFSTSEELTIVNSGTKALKMTTAAVASKKASRYWDIPNVRAGARWNWTVALRGDGTRTARFRILNRQTGNYWTGSAWSATPTDLASRSTASYATSSGTFSVESLALCRSPLVTLRVMCLANDATVGAAYADDAYLWPSWDFVSQHGHRTTEGLTCQARSSTDGFGGSDVLQATLTIAQPAFYAKLGSPCDHRYARLKFVGSPLAAVELGELAFGQALVAAEAPSFPFEWGHIEDDVAAETTTGDSWSFVQTYHHRRTLGLKFDFAGAAAYEEARDEIWKRCRGRRHRLVIVPDDMRPDVIFGKLDRSWKVLRSFVDFYDENSLTVLESPFAAAG